MGYSQYRGIGQGLRDQGNDRPLRGYTLPPWRSRPDRRVLLLTANKALELSVQVNAQLKETLAAAELPQKRLKRNSRRDEGSLKDQLAVARRGGRM